ncbi:MAG: hypothetical protein LHV68_09795 [Elusimicrobia bacterium]|nr:hypothetical protein [Candidatus Liberimonas magnetica]
MKDFGVAYSIHVNKLLSTLTVHRDICEDVLMDKTVIDKISFILGSKYDQTFNDRLYHHALLCFPLQIQCPSYCVLEIGCAVSIPQFKSHINSLEFDSYGDYVDDIISGKWLAAYLQLSGETMPDGITDENINKFFFGHFLVALEENMIFSTILWVNKPTGIELFSRELI